MAENLKALREQRGQLAEEIQRQADVINTEERDFSPEEQQAWDKVNADYDALVRRITATERAQLITDEVQEPADGPSPVTRNSQPAETHKRDDAPQEATDEDRALALQAWCRHQTGRELDERQQAAIQRVGMPVSQRELEFNLRSYSPQEYRQFIRQVRAQGTQVGSEGGHLIPEDFVTQLEVALLAYGGMRQVATIMRTASGNPLPWPTVNDTTNKGALIAENTGVGEQDVAFGQVVFNAYKYTSKMIKVPVELLEDSAIDLVSYLAEAIGTRIARITNEHFTTADGDSKPEGIVTGAAEGKDAASSTEIDPDEILDLIHSIDPAYRNQPGAGFMMNDAIIKAVRKLKQENQYVWQPGLQAGVPDRLFDYPVTMNQDMASTIEQDAKTMIFGLLSKYKIRDVSGFRLRRLQERYAESDQEAFVAFSRHDGHLLDAGTNPVKYLIQNKT